MFTCRACLQKTRNALAPIAKVSLEIVIPPRARIVTSSTVHNTRSYATASAETERPIRRQGRNKELTLSQTKDSRRLEWVVRKHLERLDDPYGIAQHVENTLKKDRFEEALLLTQTASKDNQVVVSWNHLISYLFEKQRLHAAIKLFNEVSNQR
jgi:pentatricopeptide repeat protein